MQEVTEGSWAGPWRKELKQRSRRNAAQWLAPHGLLDQLCIQGTLAQWWHYPHWAELSPQQWLIKKMPQACLQASLKETFSQMRLLLPRCPTLLSVLKIMNKSHLGLSIPNTVHP